ncbi:hypothetical protein Poli38472_005473 [Pythium oligandrum]|uniref:Uncharacterized protein n=1 Tax=Pythium oligandrum TaxID=41045 RepID=A0A8K1CHK7_PYTOL|nr:hypothetical protein Poli38472_005473 [Pythium oligandrum]|eukprot:TMW62855.1 hypothetical protein Poli38472_005473 [Pythium oligandrum]
MGEVKVAYQGVPGAYSEKATRQLLGSSAQVVALGFPSFEAAFRAVEDEEVDFAVLPIENSLGGSIHANYDLLLKYGLHIVGEYDLRVEHSLLALPGVSKADIKTVISHPQALAQCTHTIEQIGAQPRAEYDTAGSAKMLADNQWKDTAAIASDLAAEYYGLQVLERNVEDDSGNFTRFMLLSKKEDLSLTGVNRETVEFKTSLVFSFMDRNEKGQLYKALSAFSLRDIDLAKMESRPWGYSAAQQYDADASLDFSLPPGEGDRRKYKYLFYIDIIGHQTDEPVVNALRHLRELCKFVRVLGSYPTKGQLIGDVRKTLEAVGAAVPASGSANVLSPALAPEVVAKTARQTVGIYGFGNFGQFLAKTISKYHTVRATSRTDYTDVARSLGCEYFSSETQLEKFFEGLDVLVLCVSILSFENVVKSIPAHLLENVVIIDVLSVKTHPKQILLRDLPASSSILCTHPMFGPESGKYSWRGLPMMYEKVRVVSPEHGAHIAQFLRVFELELCRMLELTCESHDEFAASSQFLTHLTGRILSVQGVKNTPIDTRGFKNLVRLVEDTCKDSFDLFQGLYEFNPNSGNQIHKFEESLKEVVGKLKAPSKGTKEPETMAEKYPLNPLVHTITAAKTVVIHGMTKQLEAEGKEVYSLCVGEPDFLPAQRVLDAGKEGFEKGMVKYTDVKGTIALRRKIAEYLERCKGVKYNPQTEILVSNGAKQSVFQTLLAVCKPGEKVLIPSPYWVSYPSMVKLVNAKPVILRTKIEDNYLINPDDLEQSLLANPEVKVMILCNPSNPAGTLHGPEHLERIAAVLRKPAFRHVLIIADEIYEQLLYQEPGVPKLVHQCFASIPGMYERTFVINGFSKAFAMPGLRIGYLAAPKYFVDVCTKLQGQFTSCASSIGQHVALEAITDEMEWVDQKKDRIAGSLVELDRKRLMILQRLKQLPKIRCAYPNSAFYIFMDLSGYFQAHQAFIPEQPNKAIVNADDFCEYLLQEYQVALVPGSAFGEDYCLRISYASSTETIVAAMDGLEKALNSLTLK